MAHIVKTHGWKFSTRQELFKMARERHMRQIATLCITEDQITILPDWRRQTRFALRTTMHPQSIQRKTGQHNRTTATPCLRRCLTVPFAIDKGQRTLYAQHTALEVDIGPFQCA